MPKLKLILNMITVLVAMATILLAQSAVPILPSASSPQPVGAEFLLEVKVGSAANPISDLFGLSFILNFTHTGFLDVVPNSVVPGDLPGSDLLFFPNVDEPAGKISVGMSRKPGQGGVNGHGSVLQAKFISRADTPSGAQVQFMLTEVSANNPNGSPIALTPGSLTVSLGACPAVRGINPKSGPVGATVTITGTELTEVTAVKFSDDVTAVITANTGTEITTTVPSGAASGPITLRKAGCPEVQTEAFTVLSRDLRVMNADAPVGGTVNVTIALASQGDENALGFSLIFDPAILSNPQATLGRDAGTATLNTNSSQASFGKYGMVLALPAGQQFFTGTHEIVNVSFLVNPATTATSTTIGFGDQPITREVADINANTLSTIWISGTVTITPGYEADVSPRPLGNQNGTVALADWVQMGRFVALLDTPSTVINEFQRADCAPAPCGDGRLTTIDWVKAGRYAAQLDAAVVACGPTQPTTATIFAAYENLAKTTDTSAVCILDAIFAAGQKGTLMIELKAQGHENALGFSLKFDPTILTFEEARLGNDALGAMLHVNASAKANGQVGIVFALPAGQALVAGTRQIMSATFSVNPNLPVTSTTIDFGDLPIAKEAVDVNAGALPANWKAGTVALTGITAVEEIANEIPTAFALAQNYPNPFSGGGTFSDPSTKIIFSLPRAQTVSLKVFDLAGNEVATLINHERKPAGHHEIMFDAGGLANGVYLYRLQAGEFSETKKMLVVK